jgi:hypothetical protein
MVRSGLMTTREEEPFSTLSCQSSLNNQPADLVNRDIY